MTICEICGEPILPIPSDSLFPNPSNLCWRCFEEAFASAVTGGRGKQNIIVELTNEEIDTLWFVLGWYDRNWTIGGVRTRSAELYDDPASYEDFHKMAQAFGTAIARAKRLPETIGGGHMFDALSDEDIVIAATTEGFRLFAGKEVGHLLWRTVCEAARIDWRPNKRTHLNSILQTLKAAIGSAF